jgi:hypothetical protein
MKHPTVSGEGINTVVELEDPRMNIDVPKGLLQSCPGPLPLMVQIDDQHIFKP